MTKEAFNRKISLLTSKLNTELRMELVRCYGIASYGSETWTLRKLEWKFLESFEIRCWRKMEKIICSEKVAYEEVIKRIEEKRTLLYNILHRNTNLFGHTLIINCLLCDAIEGKMTELIGVGRTMQFLDDLKNRRRYWQLKEKLKIEKGGNDTLSHEHQEEIQVFFQKSMDLLTGSILNNNTT